MDIVRTAANPWGQDVLVGVSWDLMWAALIASVLFVVGHAVFVAVRNRRAAGGAAGLPVPPAETEGPRPSERVAAANGRVVRHSPAARAFHWIMSIAMFGLLITAFVPVMGLEFAWVELHWMAGLLLVAAILFHIVHAVGWQRLSAMWITARDVREARQEMRHARGGPDAPPAPRTGKYPVDHKLYHHMATVVSLAAIGTGLLMMVRIDTPFWTRDPYLLSDGAWGVVYVLHGVSGVALIGLVAAHVYFAIRPEKRWITWSMVHGWITRQRYVEHFDPERWQPEELEAASPRIGAGGAVADAAAHAPREEA